MVVVVQVGEDQHLELVHLLVLLRYEYLAWKVAIHHLLHLHHWLDYHWHVQRVLMLLEVMTLLDHEQFLVLELQYVLTSLCEVLKNLLAILVEVWLVLE